jgi:nucleoporin NUP42
VQYVYNAENEHPNRIDICNSNSLPALGGTSPFNQPSTNSLPTANAFSSATSGIQPTSTANPFGASSTQAVQPAIGTGFGQPSSLGQRVNPFGASNVGGQTGASGSNAFLAPGPSSSAGNPFGAPSQAPRSAVPASNPFGAPSQPAASNPFGGAAPAPAPNPFGSQPTPAAAPNPFGAIVQPANSNPFSAAPSSVSLSPIGAPTPPVISIPQGAPSAPVAMNPFGAPSPASANPFGASSQPPATSASRFGQPPVPYQQNPFGAPKPQTSNGFTQGASAAPATTGAQVPSPYAPTAESQHPSIDNYSSRDGNGRLTMFKGKAVVYNNGVEKIWFPNGAPPYYKATEADDELYDEATKASYFHMRETGTFPNGEIPLVPPKREFCLWDF